MFKYAPIDSFTLRNLQNSQIYFNNPLNFNDPFDTSHPVEVNEISNKIFVQMYCKYSNLNFSEKHLNEILNKTISKNDFYDFCFEHLDYILNLENSSEVFSFKSKDEILGDLRNLEETHFSLLEIIYQIFVGIKFKWHPQIQKSIKLIREENLSKLGVCCFSKNNRNLLMWAHYADSHKGICLEFDSKVEPFSKAKNVNYQSKIQNIDLDLYFENSKKYNLLKKLLLIKSVDWKYEKEMRIFSKDSNISYNYNPGLLKAIYFGLKANRSDIEIICSIVKYKNNDVKFYQMKKLEKTFGIEPIQLD